jgi:hypothetical protein
MLEPKFHVSNSKNKDFLYNCILDKLIHSIDAWTSCSWVRSNRVKGSCYPSIRDRVHHSGMPLCLHLIWKYFKDEKNSDYKTVSVPQNQLLAGLKTLGLVGWWATFEGSFFKFWGAKKFLNFFFKIF